jgi:hypothetical protein
MVPTSDLVYDCFEVLPYFHFISMSLLFSY